MSDLGDGLRHITSGPLHIVFLTRGHLYFVAASTRAEPVPALRQQLHMLHQHLLLLVTGGECLQCWPTARSPMHTPETASCTVLMSACCASACFTAPWHTLTPPGIERALTRNPGYDVRHLLSSSSCSLSALLSSLGDDPFWLMGVLHPAPLGAGERRAAAAALAAAVQVGALGRG